MVIRTDDDNNYKTIVINKIENHKGYVIIQNKKDKKFYMSGICLKCGSFTSTANKEGNEKWYYFKDGLICHSCYRKKSYQESKLVST